MKFETSQGDPIVLRESSRGFELFPNSEVIAVLRNGEAVDLNRELEVGDSVEPIKIGSPKGLEILRHSTAHILAQAMQKIDPEIRLGIGPPIDDGFYYDFDSSQSLSPEVFAVVEKEMKQIIKRGQVFSRRVVSAAEALQELQFETYKCELIKLREEELGDQGESVEVGSGELTIYDNIDPQTGQTVWKDLCRGPHLPNTKLVGNGWKLTRLAAAYWRGSEENPQLQRVYGTAWATKDDLHLHLERLEEAAKRDHRKLGRELDLFSFPEETGSGLAVFHPKGGVIRKEMEDYSRAKHSEAGYEFVYTPHITKSELFETSGHLGWYQEGMFPPMRLDEHTDEKGAVLKHGSDYYLKPMNCPFHILIYRSRQRSYRDLPMRLFEFGSVYRYEKSGVVHGLTRVRGLTMDDAHIFVTDQSLEEELTKLLRFVLELLSDFGLDDFYLELSTRDGENEKFVGADHLWSQATETLQSVAENSGLDLVPDPGGAAFYGPKISVQARDALGRSWQMSTIQLDFNLPERFDLEFQDSDGSRKRPIMIHRALFGSVERFLGVLTEHYAGAFPPWLAPIQVIGIPVAAEFNEYLQAFIQRLRAAGIRAELDDSDDRMQKKIRNQTRAKVPFILIAGENDRREGAVSFRFRDGTQKNSIPLDRAFDIISEKVSSKSND